MKSFFVELQDRNEVLFWFGWCNVIAALVCLVLLFTTNTYVLGINAWIKPMKFFLSSAIFTWSMAWYMVYLNEPTTIAMYNWVLIIVLSFELVYIAIKAAQGELSHFNISSAFNGLMFSLMGIAISALTLWTGYIGCLFFIKSFPGQPPAYIWGIRLGILFFVIFAFEGGAMAAKLAHTVGATDGGKGLPFTNWSTRYGDLRVAHFIGMHALQILPLLSFYLVKNIKGIVSVAFLYFLITSLLFIQAMLGKPLIKL